MAGSWFRCMSSGISAQSRCPLPGTRGLLQPQAAPASLPTAYSSCRKRKAFSWSCSQGHWTNLIGLLWAEYLPLTLSLWSRERHPLGVNFPFMKLRERPVPQTSCTDSGRRLVPQDQGEGSRKKGMKAEHSVACFYIRTTDILMFIMCLKDQVNTLSQDPGFPRKKDRMQNFNTTSISYQRLRYSL